MRRRSFLGLLLAAPAAAVGLELAPRLPQFVVAMDWGAGPDATVLSEVLSDPSTGIAIRFVRAWSIERRELSRFDLVFAEPPVPVA